ncbi:hypothetical protein [Pseudomonas sp. S2_C03]
MVEVDKEVLKEAVAAVVSIMEVSTPHLFYDAGTIVMPYHIRLEGKYGKQKKASKVTVTEIHRELEWMIKSGEIEERLSWLDPKAIEEREQRAREMNAKYHI